MKLPEDKESRQLLIEELRTFKDTQAFKYFKEKLQALKDQSMRLAAETDHPQVYRHQGEYKAYGKVLNTVEDLIEEIRQTL